MTKTIWREITLGELCREGGGEIQTGPFGSQLHAADYVTAGVPSVMPINIGDNVIIESGIARITEVDAQRLSRYRLQTGDIVYSRRGDVEKRALVREEHDGWLCGTGCLRVRLGQSPDADSRFVSYLLGLPETRDWIVRHAVGATMPNLNTSILSSVPLSVPPLSTQRAIAEVLGALDDKIAANTMITTILTELRQFSYLQLPKRSEQPISQLLTRMKIGRKIIKNELLADGDWPVYDQSALGALGFLNGSGAIEATDAKPVLYFGDHTCTLRLSSRSFFVGPNTIPFIGRNVPSLVLLCALSGVQQHVEYKRHWSDLLSKSVALPDDVACSQFEKEWRDSLSLERSMREECRTLAELRDTLLPQLMSGKLRVKDAEKSLEEVL
jgi:type I restriction enzyme S subunit